MKNKFLSIFTLGTMIIAFLFTAYIIVLLDYPYKTIEFVAPTTIITKTIKQGEILKYQTHYCKYIDKPATVTRQYVDGIVYATSPIVTNNEVGCHDRTNSIIVPENLPPGVYRLKTIIDYEVNPIRHIKVEWDTDIFEVFAKDK